MTCSLPHQWLLQTSWKSSCLYSMGIEKLQGKYNLWLWFLHSTSKPINKNTQLEVSRVFKALKKYLKWSFSENRWRLSAVHYFCKKLNLRCLTRFWKLDLYKEHHSKKITSSYSLSCLWTSFNKFHSMTIFIGAFDYLFPRNLLSLTNLRRLTCHINVLDTFNLGQVSTENCLIHHYKDLTLRIVLITSLWNFRILSKFY